MTTAVATRRQAVAARSQERRARRAGAGGKRAAALALALVVAALFAPRVRADATRCTYNGQTYEEGAIICQAGLRQLCMNGEWQSQDGGFCSGQADGAPLGGAGLGAGRVVIEVPVVVGPAQE